jgi:hypothetical protein
MKCVDCLTSVSNTWVGAGDGTGQVFRCGECYYRAELFKAQRLLKLIDPHLDSIGDGAVRYPNETTAIDAVHEYIKRI